jgi:peptide deformylase
LREKCVEIEAGELPSMRSKAKQMAKLMLKSKGCGIAAPQVGISKRLMIVDASIAEPVEEGQPLPEPDPLYFVNPRVVRSWGEQKAEDEGCLSIPGITIPIERHYNIAVEAQDLDGEPFSVEAEDFFARAIQHEMDHLDGKTMFEHLDPVQRSQAFRRYEDALREGAKPGDTSTNK